MTNLWHTARLLTRPPFYIIYINDLPVSPSELELMLFADDNSTFFEHCDLGVLTSLLDDQLHDVSTWLKANKFSINVKKPKLMTFIPRQNTLPLTKQIFIEFLYKVPRSLY